MWGLPRSGIEPRVSCVGGRILHHRCSREALPPCSDDCFLSRHTVSTARSASWTVMLLQLLCSCRWWASSQPGLCTNPNIAQWYTFLGVKIAGSKVTAMWRICRHVSRSPFAWAPSVVAPSRHPTFTHALCFGSFFLLCQSACDILAPPARDQTHTPCTGSVASQPLGRWGSP